MGDEQRTARAVARPQLDRAMIVDAAMRIVRAGGLEALTMRAVAQNLGSAPMSLYRHVTDREDLLLGMLDVVAAAVAVPAPNADPRAEILTLVAAVHDVLAADPWVVQVLVVDNLASPLILPVIERILLALALVGVPPARSAVVNNVLFEYVYGEVLTHHHDKGADSVGRRMARAASAEAYPALAEAIAAVPPSGPAHDFSDNLARILDGLLLPSARRPGLSAQSSTRRRT